MASRTAVVAYCSYSYGGVPGTDLFLLAASVRRFGGSMSSSPVWIMYPSGKEPGPAERVRAAALGVELRPYSAEPALAAYPFAMKAAAAAAAESLAEGAASELWWFDRDSLVLSDPREASLVEGEALAFRPVNAQNIGQASSEEPDGFWSRVYELGGLDPARVGTTTSYMEGRELRFYAAAGLLVARPERGMLRRWLSLSLECASDERLAALARSSSRHRLFLHQAALSVAIAAVTTEVERRALPPRFMYPLNFWSVEAASRRPERVDDLVTLRYDAALEDGGWKDFAMSPGLREWIEANMK